jgi:hypothetical protein
MTKNTHAIAQGVGILLQVLNFVSGIVPPKYQPIVAGLVGAAQATVALYNHPTEPAAK